MFLSGGDGLVVPVSTLDQAYRERSPASPGKNDQILYVVPAVSQVGLDHDAQVWVIAQVVVDDEVGEHGAREIAEGEALQIEVHEDASIAGGDEKGLERRAH